ncbi:LLM class flavin-dependent oxidoreductase [Curtobacterium sp. A7_M15]|uniref:LLM class flavin-dependent oxidoreductase n=1 Tax=Curtobacterium sp. A7_M15 TaxID=3065241 RepID=UPI002737D281|nr:LLM class flavin-dependent oxidoreductase [Curtobacterium sp. A7_M15]MDP4332182.1 LLM class flavin-dependent oxidoreductase [Curtobacterium sp. A7_M15]
MTTPPFAIAIELDGDGAHPAAWRAVDHAPAELLSGKRVAATVRAAERAGFTAVTFADAAVPPGTAAGRGPVGRLDAVQRAAFAAPLTSAIGLVPVAPAVHTEPFHVSTQLATADLASDGRVGWIADTAADVRSAAVYGRAPVDTAEAVATAADAIEVVRQLWDSWEDDAVIRDTTTWRYVDRARLHRVTAESPRFSVAGPSIIPRPPQGQLPVFAPLAGGLPAGADVALVTSSAEATRRVAAAAGAAQVWLELEVALDRAGVSAARRVAALDAHEPWAPGDVGRYVGDSAGLADLLADLAGQVDGVRLRPAVLDDDLDEIGRAVLPALRAAGSFRSPRPGDQLRDVLGLPVAVNRHAASRTAALEEATACAPGPRATRSSSASSSRG